MNETNNGFNQNNDMNQTNNVNNNIGQPTQINNANINQTQQMNVPNNNFNQPAQMQQNNYVNQPIQMQQNNYVDPGQKHENVLLGIIGAIIGSLAGGALIIIFSSIGFVASIAGLAMAVCTLLLYEKFAGSISKKGIIISIVIMIIMTLLAENIAISIAASKELKAYGEGEDLSFFDIFKNLYSYLKIGYLRVDSYVKNLLLVYLFTILGATGTIIKKLKTTK